jgi:hypothetical protein
MFSEALEEVDSFGTVLWDPVGELVERDVSASTSL